MPGDEVPAWVRQWTPPRLWSAARRIERNELPALYAMIEHRAWIRDVKSYLCGQRDTPPELDPGLCRFGSWLGNRQAHTGQDEVAEIAVTSALHEQAHRLAVELIADCQNGNRTTALARMAELDCLRDALILSLFLRISPIGDDLAMSESRHLPIA
jgi:hypothetical protein